MSIEELLTDLKQFITGELDRRFGDFATRDELIERMDQQKVELINRMDSQKDEIVDGIDHSIIGYTREVDDQVQNHERRLRRLEKRAA